MEPYCDSDEEVFFGPVTIKEVKKALTLRRRTERHVPISSMAEADTIKKPSAGSKEAAPHNLTFTPQMNQLREKETWNRRSLDVNSVKLFTEEEAPAPPPSPEKMEYTGSPFPTPCNPLRACRGSLHQIAEEDETDKQRNIHKKPSMLSKLSILTTMDDSLTEGVYTPFPVEQKGFDNTSIDAGDGVQHKATEEGTNGRNILLEKMKEYETQEQQIKSMKRGPLRKAALEDSLIELSTDDLLILNDVENDDYFSEESSGSPAVRCDNIEIDDNSDGTVSKSNETPGEGISDLRFSRLVPERFEDSNEGQHLEGFGSNFLGDFERRYGKHRLNEVLASLSSEESPESNTYAPDTSMRKRPVSPEYDVDVSVNTDKTYESGCSSSPGSAEISLSNSVVEISISDEDFSSEVEQLSHGVSNISVTEECEIEVLDDRVSLAAEENNKEAAKSLTSLPCDDLSESARIISDKSQLCNNESSEESSPEYGEDSKMTKDVTKQDSIQPESSATNSHTQALEAESISCSIESTSQDHSINAHNSLCDRKLEFPCNSQECTEAKYDETARESVQNNASNVGVKSYIMSDEYSLISEAESEPYTPDKKDVAYSTEPHVSLASFDEKGVPIVDKDGGFLSVLSEAALLHASLANHSTSFSGKQVEVDQTDLNGISGHNTEVSSTDDQIYTNVTKRRETSNEPLFNSSGTNQDCNSATIHPNACTVNEEKEIIVESVSISKQDYNNSQTSNEGMEADYCAGETNALDDLSETDKKCLEEDASFSLSTGTERLNDTFEEMDLLLKHGFSYMLSNNEEERSISAYNSSGVATAFEHVTPNQYVEQNQNFAVMKSEDKNDIESKAQGCPKPPSSFEAVHSLPDCSISPVPHNQAREKSHLPVFKNITSFSNPEKPQSHVQNKTKAGTKEFESPFKVPTKPVSQMTSRPGTPRVVKQKVMPSTPPFKKTGYKKIVSPVGMYIHNTPSPSLVTNVKPKGPSPRCRTTKVGPAASTPVSSAIMHTPEKSNACIFSKSNVENIDTNNIHPILPMVSYKSAPALKLDEKELEKLPKMNDRMKKLIDTPRPHVIRHEGRMKVEPSPQIKKFVSPKRSMCTDNSFNASDPEISVVVEKKATRTNTVGI